MTLYFTIHIYKQILSLPESLTESPSTSIYSSGASGVNFKNLAMTQLPGQCRIQDFIGDVDLKNCQTAQTPLVNTFYCNFKLQFEKITNFI